MLSFFDEKIGLVFEIQRNLTQKEKEIIKCDAKVNRSSDIAKVPNVVAPLKDNSTKQAPAAEISLPSTSTTTATRDLPVNSTTSNNQPATTTIASSPTISPLPAQ